MPAGQAASLYGAAAAVILVGLWIGSQTHTGATTAARSSDGGLLGGGPVTTAETEVANRDLADAVQNIHHRHDGVQLASFLKSLVDKTVTLSPSARDAVLNKNLKDVLDDLNDPDTETQTALADAIQVFSNPDFRALGFSKLARKCSSVDDSDRYAQMAWVAIAESRQSSSWYADVFEITWPIVALVLGFFVTNTFAAFLKVVGEHLAKSWVTPDTPELKAASGAEPKET